MKGALLALIFAVTVSAPTAAAAAPLSIEELLSAPTLAAYSPPAFSPDGRYLAFVVTDTKRHRTRVDSQERLKNGIALPGLAADIWVADLATGENRNITRGGHNWAPSWSPDGTRLAFLADRMMAEKLGPARVWQWARSSGELRQLSAADVKDLYTGIQWTPDGRSMLVQLFPGDRDREAYASSLDSSWAAKAGTDPSKPSFRLFEYDASTKNAAPSTDQVNLDLWRRDIGLIDAFSGDRRTLVAGQRVAHYVLSPNGRSLAYTVVGRAENPGTGQYLYRLMIADLASGEQRELVRDIPMSLLASSFSWSPGSDQIAYRTGGPTADDELYIVRSAGGSPIKLADHPTVNSLQIEIDPPVWGAGGSAVYYLRDGALWRAFSDASGAGEFAKLRGVDLSTVAPRQQRLFSPDGGRSALLISLNRETKRGGFARIDLASGKVLQLDEADRRLGGYGTEASASSDGQLLAYVAEDPLHPPEIYLLKARSMRSRQVSKIAPALATGALGEARLIDWRSADGGVQRGALVTPTGYVPGKRYPLIVKVYGGSDISKDLNRFGYASGSVENLQLYATRGYAVLLADSKVNVGTPMVDLMKSVLPGIDRAIELGVADPDRIGITGHSYGGYGTLALIAQSPRFKAAVMRAGFGDLIGSYGQLSPDGTNYGIAWSESGQGRMGGTPWEYRERYIENSPVFYLDRVTAPLLIIHGSEDSGVPAFLADEIFSGLRRLRKTVSYARYDGEEHWEGSWSYANQLDALERTIRWFDRYLKAAAVPPDSNNPPALSN